MQRINELINLEAQSMFLKNIKFDKIPSFYYYNFVVFIGTYLFYTTLFQNANIFFTKLSIYILLIKIGNVGYNYYTIPNYQILSKFQNDCSLDFDNIVSKYVKNRSFCESLHLVLDKYPFIPGTNYFVSSTMNNLVLFSIYYLNLFLFFNIGFLQLLTLPIVGAISTYYIKFTFNNKNESDNSVELIVLNDDEGDGNEVESVEEEDKDDDDEEDNQDELEEESKKDI